MISKVVGMPTLKGTGSRISFPRELSSGPYVSEEHKYEGGKLREPALEKTPIAGVASNVVVRFSYSTKTGMAPHNPHKTNQDAYVVATRMLG